MTSAHSARERPMPDKDIRAASLEYHRQSPPGKISIQPTKQLTNQRDLALAYTPGVAAACDEIVRDPAEARNLTARGNLVGVVTNGTAVLGLGPIGPLAAKPVMEGKAVLFKKFAGIDCFDIEIDERDPGQAGRHHRRARADVRRHQPRGHQGARVLLRRAQAARAAEDPGVPRRPARHGDHRRRRDHQRPARRRQGVEGRQAGLLGRRRRGARVPRSARAARHSGEEHLGRRHRGRGLSGPARGDGREQGAVRAADRRRASSPKFSPAPTSFWGFPRARCCKPEWLAQMADKPLILALANPEPEIMPDLAKAARPDAVIATGRSDFPNQVNNVLCFPFIFRGALDVGATTVNEAMKLASVRALADLAMAEQSDIVAMAYGEQNLRFGPEYLIPRPFDPRLIVMIAPAVAKAAMDSGVATRPIADFAAYREKLTQFVYHSGLLMKPIFAAAKKDPEADRLCGRRGRARIARGADRDRRRARAADRRRPAGGAGTPGREARPAHPAGHGLPGRQSRVRPALSRLLDRVLRAHGAQGRVAAVREDRDAPAADADRRDADPHGRSGRHALRHVRHARAAPRVTSSRSSDCAAGRRSAPR